MGMNVCWGWRVRAQSEQSKANVALNSCKAGQAWGNELQYLKRGHRYELPRHEMGVCELVRGGCQQSKGKARVAPSMA